MPNYRRLTASNLGATAACASCNPPPTYNYYIAKGCPGGTYNGFDRKVKSTASLNYNGTPTGGDSFSEFGSCWYIDGASTETAYDANLNCGCGTGNTCSSADCSSLDVSNFAITSGCAACAGGGSNNITITDCITGQPWSIDTGSYPEIAIGSVYRYTRTGSSTVYCGTAGTVNSGPKNGDIESPQAYGCGDTAHCPSQNQ